MLMTVVPVRISQHLFGRKTTRVTRIYYVRNHHTVCLSSKTFEKNSSRDRDVDATGAYRISLLPFGRVRRAVPDPVWP